MGNTKSLEKTKTVDLVLIAAGAALITICSWISIPTAVPFTLQTFAVFASLLILGGERDHVFRDLCDNGRGRDPRFLGI